MNIKQLRKAKGWSQQDLADRSGWDQSTIQRAEAMKEGIRIQVYMAIAEALGVDLADLFAGERAVDEIRILSAYRSAGEEGRRMWERLASDVETRDPQPKR